MLAIHVLAALLPALSDLNEKNHIPHALEALLFWLMPATSNLCSGMIYGYALGYNVDSQSITRWALALVGLFMAVMGNYPPKSRPNHFFGTRYSATLSDPEIWRRVNRFAGWEMSISGVLVMLTVWLPSQQLAQIFLSAGILLLVIGSFIYAEYLVRKRE